MNVAGYCRVSTETQKENYSIPQQKQFITDYCKLRGWNLVKIYVDAGFSGANTNRPALQDLRDNLKYYDIVLVYKLDRLSRSQKDTLQLVEEFSNENVKFTAIQENFDTSTPLGMAMLGILSAFAQLERENIKERMALGRKGRTEKGLWRAGSNVPTGYDYIDGHLVIREDEAVQIRKIFELYLQGKTINQISAYMHQNYTNRYSSWAHSSSVTTVLRNKLYIGLLPSQSDGIDYQGEHEPIIDKDTFDKAQLLLKARLENLNPTFTHPFRAKYLLTGFTFCGECGGRVSIISSHHYEYYGCNHSYQPHYKKLNIHCNTPRYRSIVLDQIIRDEVLKLAFDDNAIKSLIKPRKEVSHKKALKQLENQKSRLIDLYSVGGIELEALQIKIAAITDKIAKLKEDHPAPPELSFEDARKVFDQVEDIFNDADNIEGQRVVLQTLIKKIVLVGNNVEIHWRFE